MRKRLETKEHWRTRRAKAGARERWRRDAERRAALAALDSLRHPGSIVLRVVSIRNEVEVKEVVIFDLDSEREARRKIRALKLV